MSRTPRWKNATSPRDIAIGAIAGAVKDGATKETLMRGAGGGSGPARDGRPAYKYQIGGFFFPPGATTSIVIPRGKIAACLGDEFGIFKLDDLIAEIRSGYSQSTLL